MNPSFVQKSSVAAAEIYQPGFADVLQMNQRVSTRHFWRFQHDHIGGDSSERTTAMDRMAFAIGRFEPGTFLLGCVHAGTFYQKSWWTQSVSFGGARSCEPANPKRHCRSHRHLALTSFPSR